MVATAQRFAELLPGVEIHWSKRSLQGFADQPVDQLAAAYDLLVIDHPFVGAIAGSRIALPLDEHLPREFLDDQEQHSVGMSHRSYSYGGHQWALAIDAAAPVGGWRPEVIQAPAGDWAELLGLGRAGLVAVAALPVDSLMNFFMLCCTLGEEPCATPEKLIHPDTGAAALELLRELHSVCPPQCFEWNPIAVWEALASGGTLAYCPFAYGYSNYGRSGYARHRLRSGALPALGGQPCRSTLGGTGLAISAKCREPEAALAYAQFVASADCQTGIYWQSGGQPGYREAWLDEEANRACEGFFRDTLETVEAAWVRPRYPGYLAFQDEAGVVVQAYLRSGGSARETLLRLERSYLRSLPDCL